VNFSFAEAVQRYYSGIKIILYNLLNVHKKYSYQLRKAIYIYFLKFLDILFNILAVQIGKTAPTNIKVVA